VKDLDEAPIFRPRMGGGRNRRGVSRRASSRVVRGRPLGLDDGLRDCPIAVGRPEASARWVVAKAHASCLGTGGTMAAPRKSSTSSATRARPLSGENSHLRDRRVGDIRSAWATPTTICSPSTTAPLGAVACAGAKCVDLYAFVDGWEHYAVVGRVDRGDAAVNCTGGACAYPP
jgi:hypothetical protein